MKSKKRASIIRKETYQNAKDSMRLKMDEIREEQMKRPRKSKSKNDILRGLSSIKNQESVKIMNKD